MLITNNTGSDVVIYYVEGAYQMLKSHLIPAYALNEELNPVDIDSFMRNAKPFIDDRTLRISDKKSSAKEAVKSFEEIERERHLKNKNEKKTQKEQENNAVQSLNLKGSVVKIDTTED